MNILAILWMLLTLNIVLCQYYDDGDGLLYSDNYNELGLDSDAEESLALPLAKEDGSQNQQIATFGKYGICRNFSKLLCSYLLRKWSTRYNGAYN